MYYKKAIVAIADGLGDRPITEFDGLTPLQKAITPNLDKIIAQGAGGLMDLVSPGIPVGTDIGHLILFGGDIKDYMGRGPIEAAGIDMDVQNGDIVFRCNFASIDKNGIVLDRRANRINHGTQQLADAINGLELGDGVTAYFKPATGHRAVLILRGENLSADVTDSDPKAPHDGKPYLTIKPKQLSESAERTSDLLNKFLMISHTILDQHPVNVDRRNKGGLPANFILTRGPGQFSQLPSLTKKYGLKACCIAGETTVLGIAKLLGVDTITNPAFTSNLNSDFTLKAKLTLEAIEHYDLVFVHIKATDLAGHDNLPQQKVTAIEHFDRMVGQIFDHLPSNTYLALAADHSTPCIVKEHTGEPVPIAIYGEGIRPDQVKTYDEIACAQGGLNRISGNCFINTILDYMGYSIKQGS